MEVSMWLQANAVISAQPMISRRAAHAGAPQPETSVTHAEGGEVTTVAFADKNSAEMLRWWRLWGEQVIILAALALCTVAMLGFFAFSVCIKWQEKSSSAARLKKVWKRGTGDSHYRQHPAVPPQQQLCRGHKTLKGIKESSFQDVSWLVQRLRNCCCFIYQQRSAALGPLQWMDLNCNQHTSGWFCVWNQECWGAKWCLDYFSVINTHFRLFCGLRFVNWIGWFPSHCWASSRDAMNSVSFIYTYIYIYKI